MFNGIDYNLYERVQYLESIINNDISVLQTRLNNLKMNETKNKKVNYNKTYYNKVKDNDDMNVKYNTSATNYYNKMKDDPIKYQEYLHKKRMYRKSLKVKTP